MPSSAPPTSRAGEGRSELFPSSRDGRQRDSSRVSPGGVEMGGDVVDIDVMIVGGGIAGLWTLAELVRHGHDAHLIEAQRLGEGQTIGAQGIIHGGLKY